MTRLWTVGHSTRPLEEFLDCLHSFQIQVLVDVRRFPTSRRSPEYGADRLRKSLFHAGIEYAWFGDELGGHRGEAKPGSPHVGLSRSGLAGYADWMGNPMFQQGAAKLVALAQEKRCATMCAERPPSGCHRSLLGDYLTLVHEVEVRDILDPGVDRAHFLTPGVVRDGGGILYGSKHGRLHVS